MHFCRWRPGWARFFTFYFGGPVDWRVFAQLADTDRQNNDGVGAFRVVVQTHFSAVNNNTFMHGIRQDQLLRNVQHGAAFRQEGIHARVGFQHVRQTHLILCRKILQRLGVAFRNSNDLVLANQTATIGRQRVRDG